MLPAPGERAAPRHEPPCDCQCQLLADIRKSIGTQVSAIAGHGSTPRCGRREGVSRSRGQTANAAMRRSAPSWHHCVASGPSAVASVSDGTESDRAYSPPRRRTGSGSAWLQLMAVMAPLLKIVGWAIRKHMRDSCGRCSDYELKIAMHIRRRLIEI